MQWAGAVALIALVGAAGGLAAQAARRTDTAFARNLASANATNAIVSVNAYSPQGARASALRLQGAHVLDALEQSPLIAAHGRFAGNTLYRIVDGKIDRRLDVGSALGFGAYDDAAGRTIATIRLRAGRLADPTRADEIVVSTTAAKATGWKVGTRITDLRQFDLDEQDPATGLPDLRKGTQLSVVVVGIGEMPEELLQNPADRVPRVFFTPAFQRQFPNSAFYLNELIRLRPGADMTALRAAVAETARRVAPTADMIVAPTDEGLRKVENSIDPLVRGLWALAALAALIGIALAAQSLGQIFAVRADEHAQLRALGATRGQRVSVELAPLLAAALVAAVFAALMSYALSALTPVGSARDAEPHPGMVFDLALLGCVVALTLVGAIIAALPSIRRLVTTNALPGPTAIESRERGSRFADLAARTRLSVAGIVGTRFAFQSGRGRSATPVHTVLATLMLVVAAATATLAFGTSLHHWTTTPRLYGWNWDVAVGSNFGTVPREAEAPLSQFADVTHAGALNVGLLTVSGHAIPAIGIAPIVGTVAPALNRGRLPATESEIVLGARTMRQLHAHIGNRITGRVGTRSVALTVVGTTTFPAFGNGRFGDTGLGTGALGTTALFTAHDETNPGGRYNYVLLQFRPGTATTATSRLRAFLAEQGCADASCIIADSRPAEIDGYRNANGLPVVIGVVLALFLVATLVHALVSTMRRRVTDLSVLRALGCTPRQLSSTLRWQGFVLTASAIVVGVPVGLVAGRFAWRAFASHIGIAPDGAVPLLTLAIAAAGLLVITMIVASVVGWRVPSAVRRDPART
jgi:putative ABC transport system permease protein